MASREATCHCRSLVLACEGQPRKISMCHCHDCQRRTGSAYGVAVFFERGQVRRLAGETATFERPSASGFPVAFHFCTACGANVFWEPARMPELIGVAYGAFAGETLPPPQQAVWMAESCGWIEIPPDLPRFDANPTRPAADPAS